MVLKTVLVLLLPLNSLTGTVEPAKRTGLVLGSVPAPVASGARALVPMQWNVQRFADTRFWFFFPSVLGARLAAS